MVGADMKLEVCRDHLICGQGLRRSPIHTVVLDIALELVEAW